MKMENGYGLVELPIKSGIKKFKLQYKNNLNTSSLSDQTVIVLVDNEKNSVPKVARVLNSDVESIDMLNLEKINDSITLDVLSYSPPGLVIISGRTIPNTEIEIFKSAEFLEIQNQMKTGYGNLL